MKQLLVLLSLFSINAYGAIPTGSYKLEKIVCASGKQLKLGGKFMSYDVRLDVGDASLKMTAVAKTHRWASFILNCTQVNNGKYSLIDDNKYEGFLAFSSANCNVSMWERRLQKKGFGVEDQGVFDYKVNGNQLVISNPNTITKYSCAKENSYPIYYYNKL